VKKCFKCGSEDHSAADSKKGVTCYKCQKEGNIPSGCKFTKPDNIDEN